MCLNSSSSSSNAKTTTTDSRVGADNGGVAIGSNSPFTLDQSGFHSEDLKNTFDFLAQYGQGLKDVTTQSLDTIKQAQVNQKDPTQGTAQTGLSVLGNFAWPIAASLAAAVLLHLFSKGKFK